MKNNNDENNHKNMKHTIKHTRNAKALTTRIIIKTSKTNNKKHENKTRKKQ